MTTEIVKQIYWTPKWDGGAPMPQVFSNGDKIYLIYTIADWDEKSIDKYERLKGPAQSANNVYSAWPDGC